MRRILLITGLLILLVMSTLLSFADGDIPDDGWWEEDGQLYYYLEGFLVQGWNEIDGEEYYFYEDGSLALGWFTSDNSWYYFSPESFELARGWHYLDGEEYYFYEDGSMTQGWLYYHDHWYYLVPSSGAMAKGFKEVSGHLYYLSSSGVMEEGWKYYDGFWYYFNPGVGNAARGWREIKGVWYYFNSSGTMAEGWLFYKDKWYYLNPKSGSMAQGWEEIDGIWYYFSSSGTMAEGWLFYKDKWYYLNPKSGSMAKEWKNVSGYWYYFNNSGAMTEGWKKYQGNWYYLAPSKGFMYSSRWLKYQEEWYYLNSGGQAAKGFASVNGVNYIFHEQNCQMLVDGARPVVALTFDDGPGPYTSELLSFLKAQGVEATFFLIGSSIGGYESVVARMAKDGHTVANHTYSHPFLTNYSNSSIQWEVNETDRIIKNIVGRGTDYLRPPYGDTNSRVAGAVNKSIILWDIDTMDWYYRDATRLRNYLLNNTRDGSIVLMHDIHYPTIVGVKAAIPTLIQRGYQLVNLDTLFKIKNTKPRASATYYSVR